MLPGHLLRRFVSRWNALVTACRSVGLLFLAAACPLHAQADGSVRAPWPFTTLSTSTAGNIISSPAVAPDGTVYIGVSVGSATSASPSGRLFALNPNGSKKFTEITVPEWVDATPAIGADGTIYFGCWDGNLYAHRSDGTRRWAFKAGSFIASSPAIGPDGTIYVGAGSNLVAVNPDGTLKWSFPAGDWIDSSPAVGPDGTIYVGSWDDLLYAVRPDGSERWSYATAGNISSSPALAADGTIYVGSRDALVHAVNANGTARWTFDTRDVIDGSPVLSPTGVIYIATTGGRVHALNRDGTERWRYPAASQPALNAIFSTPAVRADGAIVFAGSVSNTSHFLHALRPDGTLLWRTAMGDFSDSSPVVTTDGIIYVGCADKRIYAFNSTASASVADWSQFRREPLRTGWAPVSATPGTTGRLINLAVRTFAGGGGDTLIVGFAAGGPRSLLVRGVGPTLADFGVTGVLANPRITVFAGESQLASNDELWQAANASAIAGTAAAVGAFPLPANSLDAALLRNFSAGLYTVHVAGAADATGVALMEAYDATDNAGARLTNISARSRVSTGAGILIAGFVVGENTRAVLVRGIGPALAQFLDGALADSQLRVFRTTPAGNVVVAENDDWSAATNSTAIASESARVGAFALSPGSRDACLLLTLPPGAYTAQVSGANGATGVGLVEVYELP